MNIETEIVQVAKQALGNDLPSFLVPEYVAVDTLGSIYGFFDRPVFNANSGLWKGSKILLLGQVPRLSISQAESLLFSVQKDPSQPGYTFPRCPSEFATWKAAWLGHLRTEFLLAIWNEQAFEEYCRQQWQFHQEVRALTMRGHGGSSNDL